MTGTTLMSTVNLGYELETPAPNALWRRFVSRAPRSHCRHLQSIWRRIHRPQDGIVLQGLRYCPENCLEPALNQAIRRIRSATSRPRAPHRIPLGLVLLSKQQITVEQLRTALARQREAGSGRIGDWLITLGFVSEQQLTAALARQWSCPVLRSEAHPAGEIPQIPSTLLQCFRMAPVDYVPVSSTLHLAFAEQIDYTVLYAIEQITGCRTEPCMALPSLIHPRLEALGPSRSETELVFDRGADDQFSSVVRSYADCLPTSEIRLAACASHVWVRLLLRRRSPLDLLLRSGSATPPQETAF